MNAFHDWGRAQNPALMTVKVNPPYERSAYSTGFHGIGISRYPVVVFSTWATEGNG